jgi:hypothetical protein
LKIQLRWAFAIGLLAAPAAAQPQTQTADGGPDPSIVRVRIGPLWMNPTISLPNMGIDTNVFNDPEGLARRDFTITMTPRTDLWLRMGRTWLSGSVTEDIVWYKKYDSERSANSSYAAAWKAPFNRVVLTGTASYLSSRARPGFEIDARAQRTEPVYGGSAEIRALSRTYVGVRGNWSKVSFDEGAFYNGESLEEQLDRKARSIAVTLRHDLTPLTSLTFSAGRSEERFVEATSRDADSDEYKLTVNFDPAALLKGSVTFGYTSYKPLSSDLPGYRGVTSAVNLSYSLLGATRFIGSIVRQISLSYDIDQPYYVLSGLSGSIAQQIYGPVDVIFRGSAQRLEYTTRTGAPVLVPDRTDRVRLLGGGVGYRLSQDLRLGFNIDKERRTSILVDRRYEGLKYGTSLTYGY